jgi:hypothetical protein
LLAHDGKRKIVTALFADYKGSAELMEGLDPEESRGLSFKLPLYIDEAEDHGPASKRLISERLIIEQLSPTAGAPPPPPPRLAASPHPWRAGLSARPAL